MKLLIPAVAYAIVLIVLVTFDSVAIAPKKNLIEKQVLENQSLGKMVGPKKKKPKMMQHGQKKKKVYEDRPFNVDIFIGGAKNYASGDYVEYQKSYALLSTDNFKYTSTTSDFNSMNFGIQMRGFPFMDYEDFKSKLSGIVGVAFLRKGFDNEVILENTALNYTDITKLKESIRANYLSSYFMARYGRLIFVEVGFTLDWFIQGTRLQEISRATSGENAYIEPFTTNYTSRFSLDGKTMSKVSLGWIGGVGYQVHPLAGIRIGATINTGFFKDGPDFTNFQPSIQAFVTLN